MALKASGEHVHFVDHVDLEAAARRRVQRRSPAAAHLVDPVLDAASISSRSTKRPASISAQAEHSRTAVAVMPVSQLRHLARMRASVVLPTPRVPVNR